MHVVVATEDSMTAVTQQMMFESDLPGVIPVERMTQLGLIGPESIGFCNLQIDEVQLQNHAQLRLLAYMMERQVEPAELKALPAIPRQVRLKVVVRVLSFCVGLHEVNKPLWSRTKECEIFFATCGPFAIKMMGISKDLGPIRASSMGASS